MDMVQKAFEAMRKGKSLRITKEFRDEINKNRTVKLSDIWFMIGSIHSDDTITICGNNHTIFKNYPLTILQNL